VDYRAESELGALAGELLADLERLRPGVSPAAGGDQDSEGRAEADAIRNRAHLRLRELYRERHEALGEALLDGSDGGGAQGSAHREQLQLFQREIDQIFLPRYTSLALHQNQAERAGRGADGFNRAAYALIFFLLGAFVVWAPFIPIWEKWIPFALAGLAAVFSQALPDLRLLLLRRRYQVLLLGLLIDIDQAGKALPSSPEKPLLGPHQPGSV
jgi:hypothetical protein